MPARKLRMKVQILRILQDADLRVSLAQKAFDRTRSIVNYQQHYSVLKGVFERVGLAL